MAKNKIVEAAAAAEDKTIDQLDPGGAAQAADLLPIERGNLNFKLTVSAVAAFVNANLNGVQTLTVGAGLVNSGTATNPNIAADTGTAEGQIPILGEPIKDSLATLSNEIYGGQTAMTDPQTPHNAKPIDQVAAELLALIQAAGGVTGISDGTDTATGLVQLLAGSNVTITKHPTIANAFVIAATGGGGGDGVDSLNGLTGALEIFEGYGINVDSTSQPGKIILSVPNNNLAATYVDVVLDMAAQPLASTYNNGTSGVGATLTASTNGAFPSIDGVTATLGMRLAVIKSANAAYNGIYNATDLGSASTQWVLTRAADFNTIDTMIDGTTFTVKQGTEYGNGLLVFSGLSGTPPVIGVSNVMFNFISERHCNRIIS